MTTKDRIIIAVPRRDKKSSSSAIVSTVSTKSSPHCSFRKRVPCGCVAMCANDQMTARRFIRLSDGSVAILQNSVKSMWDCRNAKPSEEAKREPMK